MRNFSGNWKHRVFKLLAVLCVLALLTLPGTWHMLFLFFDASTIDILAFLLEAQVAVVIAIVLRYSLKPMIDGLRRSAREIRVALRRSRWIEWSGPFGACVWLWWATRDERAALR